MAETVRLPLQRPGPFPYARVDRRARKSNARASRQFSDLGTRPAGNGIPVRKPRGHGKRTERTPLFVGALRRCPDDAAEWRVRLRHARSKGLLRARGDDSEK